MDPDSKHENLERNTKTEYSNSLSNDSDVLKSIRVRYSTVVADSTNRKFIESQSRFVLYSGIILWFIYLITS